MKMNSCRIIVHLFAAFCASLLTLFSTATLAANPRCDILLGSATGQSNEDSKSLKTWLQTRPDIVWHFKSTVGGQGIFTFPPGDTSEINRFAKEIARDYEGLILTSSPQVYASFEEKEFGGAYVRRPTKLFDGFEGPEENSINSVGIGHHILDLTPEQIRKFKRDSGLINHELVHARSNLELEKNHVSIFHTAILAHNETARRYFRGGFVILEELLAEAASIKRSIQKLIESGFETLPFVPSIADVDNMTPEENVSFLAYDLYQSAEFEINIAQQTATAIQDLRTPGAIESHDLVEQYGHVWTRIRINHKSSGRKYAIVIPLLGSSGLQDPRNETQHFAGALANLTKTIELYHNESAHGISNRLADFQEGKVPATSFGAFVRSLQRPPWK